MADIRKFIMHSDYPMDKIVFMIEGTATLPANGDPVSIAHNLPFTPLCMGSWSTTADFSTSYDFMELIYSLAGVITVNLASFYNRIELSSSSNTQQTIYYRIYAFAPSDYAGDIAPPNKNTGYRLNSDNNYMKLSSSGKTTIAPDGTASINHNLGFVPMVIVWTDAGGGVLRHTVSDFDTVYGREVNITSSQLLLHNLSQHTNTTFHYRIYYDD